MRKQQKEILTVNRIPDIPFARVVSGIDIINDFPRHIHSDICIGIITRGERIISVKRNSVLLHRDDIFIINSGEPHICTSPENTSHSYYVIILESGFIRDIAQEIFGRRREVLFENFIQKDKDLTLRMNELIDSLLNSEMPMEKESMLYSFIEILIRYHSNCEQNIPDFKKNSRIIQKAKEHIDNNFREEISLAELSQISGVSPFHFNRLFCSEVGISPHSYLIHRRIERSKELLLKSGSIVEVSLEMGFADQSHFSRFFRKIVGTTPGNYIKHNL